MLFLGNVTKTTQDGYTLCKEHENNRKHSQTTLVETVAKDMTMREREREEREEEREG